MTPPVLDLRATEKELRDSHTRLDLLVAITSELLRAEEPQEIVRSICTEVLDFLDCQVYFNYLLDKKQGRLRLNACGGIPAEAARHWLEPGAAVSGAVARDGAPAVASELKGSADPSTGLVRSYGIRAYACLPLKAKGAVLGTLSFGTRTRSRFSQTELAVLQAVTDQIAVALEREQMAAELAEQTARLQLFVEHAPAALAMFDTDMRYLCVSRRWISDYHLEGRELIGASHYEIFPEIPPDWREAHRRGMAGEVLGSDADLFERSDGTQQWSRWEIRPWRNPSGSIGGIVIFSEDITARKRREMHLALLSQLAGELGRLSREPEILSAVSARVVGYLGLSGCQFLDIEEIDGEDRVIESGWSRDHAGRRFSLADCLAPSVEEELRGGGTVAVEDAGLDPRADLGGCAAAGVAACLLVPFHRVGLWTHLLSVTAAEPRRWREDEIELCQELANRVFPRIERARVEEALRKSQLRLSSALEGGKMGMWEWELGSNRSVWSPLEYELLGLPAGDDRPPTELFFRHVHPDDLERLKATVGEAIAQRRNWEDEFRIVRPDGEVRWLVGAAHLVLGPEGDVEKMVGVNYDITERKQVENELRLAHDTLEQRVRERTVELQVANRELESFSYSVTHELGAPLRSMNCFSNMLLEEYADRLDAEGKDYLERISAAARRMGHLIEDLLKLSRVTRRKLTREVVDLSALAREVVEDLRAAEPGRRVEVDIPGGIRGVWDAALAKLVLQNLLGNAWKYTGKVANPRIEFGSFLDGAEQVLFVRDNGVGFDMAYAEKIFLPFERLHRMGEYEGTGIGLATAQRVIAMHGGRIWAESALGKGASFYFTEGMPFPP